MRRSGIGVAVVSLAGVLFAGCARQQAGQPFGTMHAASATQPVRAQRGESEEKLAELTEQSGLSDYLFYAALNNPGLEAAFNNWKAALERVPQMRALPDPRFTYHYFIEEVETRVGPQRQGFGLSQMFPWFGRLELKGNIAAEEANMARARYESAKLKLFYEVKRAYSEYYYLSRAVAVVRENRQLLQLFEQVALEKYRTGRADQTDVIRAQVELGKLDDRLRTLLDLRRPLVAGLNASLNRPVDADLPWPKDLPREDVAATEDAIAKMYRETNPDLRELEYKIARQRLAIDLARKEYFPDVMLGVDYTDVRDPLMPGRGGLKAPGAQRSLARAAMGMADAIDHRVLAQSFSKVPMANDAGKDIWMLSLSVNLPIWYEKLRAGEREAQLRYWSAVDERTDRDNMLGWRIQMAMYEFRDAQRKIDLYQDALVPKARQSLKAVEASFRAGRSSFLDLIDAQRVLLEFELSYERALADRVQGLAELDMLVGRRIPRTGEVAMPAPTTQEIR